VSRRLAALCFAGAAVAALLGLTAAPLLGFAWENHRNQRRLDPRGWKSRSLDAQDVMWPTRLRMVDDLLGSRRLLGLPSSEVVALLGPDDKDMRSLFPGWDRCCHLGLARQKGLFDFRSMTSEWLVLRLGADGRVVRQAIEEYNH
jgi:hypothetical protein